ncbi:MAG: tyrosine-type recombinase/integrase [Nitrospirota bacterium]
MKGKYRLHRRANGIFYAEDRLTGTRKSLATKDRVEAKRILSAKNDSHAQPILSRELAKAYLQSQDPKFGERTWADVASLIDATYTGSTKERFQKFIRSAPALPLMNLRLVETSSADFLAVFAHPRAGVSTNVQLRIVHNRALDLEWILRPVLSRKVWPKIRYGRRKGITREQHEAVLRVTPNEEYRQFFELLWHTGGSQSDIASLDAGDIDWNCRRIYYDRKKLQSTDQGNACLVIGAALESTLRQLPCSGPLFPHLCTLKESKRSNYFWTKRVKAKLPNGIVLHSYRYAWAERAQKAGMPEREAMAHLGHGSKAVHRAYAKAADRVTMPLDWYEEQAERKIIDLRAASSTETTSAA